MNKLLALISTGIVTFASVAAWADDAPNQVNPPYPGYGHMWGHGMMGGWGGPWGMHPFFHPFGGLLALIGLVVVVMWVIRLVRYGFGYGSMGMHHHYGYGAGSMGPMSSGRALDILKERFAKGEIGKEEFEEKRKLIDL